MKTDQDDLERSLAHGQAALRHLKDQGLPADARYYDLWFTYASERNPVLNAAIELHLAQHGCMSAAAAQMLYNEHLAPTRIGQKLELVGGRVAGEIDDVERLIADAVNAAGGFSAALKDAARQLRDNGSPVAIQDVVARLAASTDAAEKQSEGLRRQLADARLEMVSLHRSLEAIRHESLTDQLTGLNNRKYFDHSLPRVISESTELQRPMTLIIADVDYFKRFNDRYGHQTGDYVLRLVAQTMKRHLKGQDIACRYGGEEFAIVLPNTPLAEALVVAEQIRDAVAARALIRRSTGETLGTVTLSLGVADLRHGDTPQSLIERADVALYSAKEGGRNQTSVDTPPGRLRGRAAG